MGKMFPLSGKHLRTFHRPLSPFAGGAEGAEKSLRSRTAWGSMSVEPSKLVPPEAKRPTFNLQMLHDGHAVSLVIFPNISMAGIASGSAKAPWQGDFKRGEKQELSNLAARSSRWRVCGHPV